MLKKVRVLIVDDDDSIRAVFSQILEERGFIVDSVKTGKTAIEKSKVNVYDVVLIDIRLPDIEGIELLTKLKDTVPKMRKIIMTGFPTQQNAISALNKQADAYLLKPIIVDKLLTVIDEQLKIKEEETKYSEQKVAEFMESRVKEIKSRKREKNVHF